MNRKLRVLLVEDSVTDEKLVRLELGRTWNQVELERVENAEAMRAALERTTWDLVISDWSLPIFSAPLALGVLREKNPDMAFIIVSGTIGEETAVEAMRAGADDFALKDNLVVLARKVERALHESAERATRRRVEESLRQSENRFRQLSNSGIIGIAVVNLAGGILDANDTYLTMIGYSREDLDHGELLWSDLIAPESAETVARALKQLRATGIALPWEMEAFRKDRSRISLFFGAATLEAGQFIVIVADLTDRRKAEEGKARAEDALRLSEVQLRQSQKMEAMGRLAGGVAHDFNNILSVILSYAEMILADNLVEVPVRADIEEIHKAASRAAGLTRQLLLYSRQQVVAPRVLDLRESLYGMKAMLQRILGADVDLTVSGPDVGRVNVDPSHIEQVILNLVVNARDAMPTGGKLTIETANVDLDEEYVLGHLPAKSGPYVMLAVTDNGTGMDRDTQARIFEPFFTTKEAGKGTGLGLSTVFGIVRQSGGNVWVYSEPGKGTTFKVYLPRVDGDADVVPAQVSPTTLRGTETILLSEDEEQVRTIVVSILVRQGYQVLCASNAEAALLISKNHVGSIDLLVTDVVMPRMSGPELARRLAETRPEMKVLFMSGYTDDSVVRHGVLHSGVAYLQKPITPVSLAGKVREVLDAPLLAGDERTLSVDPPPTA